MLRLLWQLEPPRLCSVLNCWAFGERYDGQKCACLLGGGLKHFFVVTPTWGHDKIWLVIFRWVETTTVTSLDKIRGFLFLPEITEVENKPLEDEFSLQNGKCSTSRIVLKWMPNIMICSPYTFQTGLFWVSMLNFRGVAYTGAAPWGMLPLRRGGIPTYTRKKDMAPENSPFQKVWTYPIPGSYFQVPC